MSSANSRRGAPATLAPAWGLVPLCLSLLLAAPAALAATIHVPGDQPTIQAAVDVASNGDTVLLADGTYQGPGNRDVFVQSKSIVIRSASDDPDLCVIDPQGADGDHHRAFVLHNVFAGLRSVTIMGGHVGGTMDEARGGAIRLISPSQPLIENVRFVSNVASMGGAVYAIGGSVRFVDCEFVGNRAVESSQSLGRTGGAVFLDSSEASFVRCQFADNLAQGDGGAIFAGSFSGVPDEPVSLLGCEFNGNSAERAGALMASGLASITDCRFEDNSADESGGAVWTWEHASITDCWFVGNSAQTYGALYTRADLDLVGSTFSENQALYQGCVRATGPDPVTITDCDFVENLASRGSSGSLTIATWGPVAVVDRCRFFSNRARWDGGAVQVGSSTTGEIRESLFVGNVAAREAGALLVEGASFLVEECTFAGNSAPEGGGIVFRPYYTDDPELLVRNTVIAFGEAGGAISCSHPGVTTTCTDIFGNAGGDALCGTDGGDNFSADPLFCDAEGGDFTLSSQSPCLPGNHPDGVDCGLIGALGEGCGPVSVTPETWARIKGRYRSSSGGGP